MIITFIYMYALSALCSGEVMQLSYTCAFVCVLFFSIRKQSDSQQCFFYWQHSCLYFITYIQPSYSSYLDDNRQGNQSNLVSYPLGHLSNSRSDRGGNRNDRNRNQNRDRYRNNSNNNRSQGNRGPSNQGPGILGAKPGDRSVPELPSNPLQVPGLVYM